MKNLLFSFGVLFSANMYTVRSQLREGDREVLKDLYSVSKSYSNLSYEVRSLVDKFLWNPITLENGNTYRLFLCSKGKGRELEQSLKCNVVCEGKNSLKTIPELLQTDKEFASLVKSQNSNYLTNKESMGLIRAQQEDAAFYKKMIDQLNTDKAEKNYIGYLENQKQSLLKYTDAWKNYAILGGSSLGTNSTKIVSNFSLPSQAAVNVISESAKAIPASHHVLLIKSGMKSVRVIPAIAAVGAAGLAYNYFKNNNEATTKNSTNLNENKIGSDSNLNTNRSNTSYVTNFSNFCTSTQGKALGATAVVGALVYGSYRLYKSDFFSESKKKAVDQK